MPTGAVGDVRSWVPLCQGFRCQGHASDFADASGDPHERAGKRTGPAGQPVPPLEVSRGPAFGSVRVALYPRPALNGIYFGRMLIQFLLTEACGGRAEASPVQGREP